VSHSMEAACGQAAAAEVAGSGNGKWMDSQFSRMPWAASIAGGSKREAGSAQVRREVCEERRRLGLLTFSFFPKRFANVWNRWHGG
jgi:hypothetical protein